MVSDHRKCLSWYIHQTPTTPNRDVPLSKQLEYYLSSVHWLDATTPPLEGHVNKLSGVVKIFLENDEVKDDDLEKAIRDGTLKIGHGKRTIAGAGKNIWKKAAIMMAVLGVILFATLLIVLPLWKQKISLETTAMGKSIAVLPFTNLSNDPDQDYFSDGMMEEILDRLFKIGDLKVISRTSSMRYRNTDKSIKEIAGELGVACILEGSVRRIGNNVRMTVQLIDAKTDAHLWSEIFDCDLSDLSNIFSIQSEVAQSVARELKAVLSPREIDLIEKIPTKNSEAYEAFLKGRFYLYKLTRNDVETANKYYEMAIEKDPEFAAAYAGIAYVGQGYVQMGYKTPQEAGPVIQKNLLKALELDSTNAEVQYTLGVIAVWAMWDWTRGEEALKKAIAINPNHAEAHAYYSHLLNIMGKPEEAMGEIELALKLDPHNPLLISLYSIDLLFVRRFDDAIKAAREAFQIEPATPVAHTAHTIALHMTGHYEEAWESLKIAFITRMPGQAEAFDLDFNELGYVRALNLAAERLKNASESTYVNPWRIAWVYLFAGDKEQALEWLEKAYEIRESNMPYLLLPTYDIIRDEPRFREIARKMGLPYK